MTISIVVNGKQQQHSDALPLLDLLSSEKVASPDMVSVELNGEVLDREAFDGIVIKDGDQLELLYFMAGHVNVTTFIA